MDTIAVVGRDEELGSIRRFLSDFESGPAAFVLSGEAGIGKTLLWETACREARGRVLSWRGVEAEAALAFAGLSELLAGVLDDVAPELAAPRRRALEVALLLAEPEGPPPDAHAIGLALLDVLKALSQPGPVLMALDDVQWLDPSSAAVLQVAMRRLRGEPVGALMTFREGPHSTMPFEVERSFPEPPVTRLSLGPLAADSVQHLLRERLGMQPSQAELARLVETSGGNPFFALELAQHDVRSVPRSLAKLLGERLARLPAETRDLIFIAAAGGRPPVEVILRAHGATDAARDALEVGIREGVVELDGERVRFTHPLLASVCYGEAPTERRRAAHRALAEAVTDVEERARHLALAADGPDALVAAELDAASGHAAARGATAEGAELSELAAASTLADDATERTQRRLRAANLHRLVGNLERAQALLEELLAELPPGLDRADVLLELATTRKDDLPRMVELCDQAFAEAAGDDLRLTRILAYRSWARMFEVDIAGALADARAALGKAEQVGDPTLLTMTIAQVATVETRCVDITPGLLERGVELEEQVDIPLEYNQSPRVALARRLVGGKELDLARAILEEREAEAATWGSEELRGVLLRSLGRVDWLAGHWESALERTALAFEFFDQIAAPHGIALTACVRAFVEVDLGRPDDARASAERGVAVSREMRDQEWEVLSLGALGRLELALGDPAAAAGYLRELPGRLLALGYNDPAVPIWADAIEVLVGLGERELAADYLNSYEFFSNRTGNALALACAARCRGLLAAANGDTDAACRALEHAVADLAHLPYPLERGRTLLCLGSVHRKAKRKRAARDALEEAAAIFDDLGARLWAARTDAELRRISGRRRGSSELTETEERVAGLAAKGRSNKQIAAELYMSVHTVSAHLSRIYRKLGIASRSELMSTLAAARHD